MLAIFVAPLIDAYVSDTGVYYYYDYYYKLLQLNCMFHLRFLS